MHRCSLNSKLEVTQGTLADYRALAAYHYRHGAPVAVKAVFTLAPTRPLGAFGRRPAGVIVYTMPNARLAMRQVATGGRFKGFDRDTALALINRNIRTIARVVVEPRFRGIGLAGRLVRETMGRLDVPIVEALALMPKINPFLERAGMTAHAPRVPVHHVELIEALGAVGIGPDRLLDPDAVQQAVASLRWPAADFLEASIARFLKSHGSRRTMPPGPERTRYILGQLTERPAYYIWFNPNLEVTLP